MQHEPQELWCIHIVEEDSFGKLVESWFPYWSKKGIENALEDYKDWLEPELNPYQTTRYIEIMHTEFLWGTEEIHRDKYGQS